MLQNKENKDFSVAVIAGGKSLRYGSPKALAAVDNRRLVDIAVQLAYRLSDHVFVVLGKDQDLPQCFAPKVHDLVPGCGPLGGLYTALKHCTTQALITMPCDMPLLTSDVYAVLAEHYRGTEPVVAVSGKGVEPLLAIWPRQALNLVERNITDKKLALRAALDALRAREIYLPQAMKNYRPELVHNVNTKEDLKRIALLKKAI